MEYDYLVVGAGLFGAVFAERAAAAGKRVLVIDKRSHIAGNVYTEPVAGINVHRYGPHIFHTHREEVWEYVHRFATFNDFVYRPLASYHGEMYSLPFNMHTFRQMWGVTTADEAAARIRQQRGAAPAEPSNLEEQAISLVGTEIYQKLIKGYTEKQWGRPCTELPPFIIKRLPVRLEYNDNYFNDPHQGIPVGGYTAMVQRMLEGIEVRLGQDYLADRAAWDSLAPRVVYTGPIDAFFGYRLGALEYRSLRFETELLEQPDFQGRAAVNYTDRETPWTRIIEHKHFEFGTQPQTVVTREFSQEWQRGDEPYYPVNDARNAALYAQYRELADAEPRHLFGGRLAEYRYYDMDDVIHLALEAAAREFNRE